jgi:hypothetical protein
MTHWRVTHQISARAYPQILRNRRWLASRSSGELRESATPWGELKQFYPRTQSLLQSVAPVLNQIPSLPRISATISVGDLLISTRIA